MLRKEPKGAEVSEDDVFVYVANFSDKKFKLKINQIQAKETPEENARTNEQVRPALARRGCHSAMLSRLATGALQPDLVWGREGRGIAGGGVVQALATSQRAWLRVSAQVLQDRQYQIDAALVRTMKARKQLSHKLLVNEVMTQLKFNLRPLDIKRRIEGLIERDYLERDGEAQDLYNYLA